MFMLLTLTLSLVIVFNTVAAHPEYLDCGGLSLAIKDNTKIMVGVPKKVSKDMAKFQLSSGTTGYKSGWTNYSLRITHGGSAMLVQAVDNRTTITGWGNGICGNDRKRPGHGLCDACSIQMYAAVFDCTDDDCIFGISGDGKSKATILVATSEGGLVSYTPVEVDV
jgi:hypothetical protein